MFLLGIFPVEGRTVVPVAGMMIGNSMKDAVVAARRIVGELSDKRDEVEASIDKAQAWLLEYGGDLRRSAPDMYENYYGHALYNVWGHSYGIQAAVVLHKRAEGNTELQAKLSEIIQYHVKRLEQDEFLLQPTDGAGVR